MPLQFQPGCPCQCGADDTYCNSCRFADGFNFSGTWATSTTLGFSTVLCERSYPISFPLARYDTPETSAPATMGYLNPGPDTCVAVRGFVAYWGYGGTLPIGASCFREFFTAPGGFSMPAESECNISILILVGWAISRLSDTAIRPRSQWCSLAYSTVLYFDPDQPGWPAVTPSAPPPSFYSVGGGGGLGARVAFVSDWGPAFCSGVGPTIYSYGFAARGFDLRTYAWSLGGNLTRT